MKKRKIFLLNLIIKCFRSVKLKRLKKIREKNKKKHPLEDYNYPLW